MVQVLVEEERGDLGRAEGLVDWLDAVLDATRAYAPERVAPVCGVEADVIRRLARELSEAERAVV